MYIMVIEKPLKFKTSFVTSCSYLEAISEWSSPFDWKSKIVLLSCEGMSHNVMERGELFMEVLDNLAASGFLFGSSLCDC